MSDSDKRPSITFSIQCNEAHLALMFRAFQEYSLDMQSRGHASRVNLPAVRQVLDILAATLKPHQYVIDEASVLDPIKIDAVSCLEPIEQSDLAVFRGC